MQHMLGVLETLCFHTVIFYRHGHKRNSLTYLRLLVFWVIVQLRFVYGVINGWWSCNFFFVKEKVTKHCYLRQHGVFNVIDGGHMQHGVRISSENWA